MLKLTDTRRVKLTLREIKSRLKNYLGAKQAFKKFVALSAKTKNRFPIRWEDIFYFGDDNTRATGFNTSYIYHIAWAARILAKTKPALHTDISSSLWFISTVSAFVKIDFYDYRPANLILDNLTTGRADLTHLHFKDNSIPSLSCMHTIEHIGLGRYGDVMDPDGDLKAIRELQRVTAHGGNLLFVVPIGKPIICFNSHRTYSYAQIREYFNDFELKDYYLIPDTTIAERDGPIENATESDSDKQTVGCGCFWFKKK